MQFLLRHKLLLGATPCRINSAGSSRGFRPQAKSPRHGLGADFRKTNKYKRKTQKFWTEPRHCMVLGLKPMGKPSTQKFWTEPRHSMVLGPKPMGKPSTKKVLDRTKALHGLRTQAYGETKYKKVLDRTKVLHGPRTQAYGETKYTKAQSEYPTSKSRARMDYLEIIILGRYSRVYHRIFNCYPG